MYASMNILSDIFNIRRCATEWNMEASTKKTKDIRDKILIFLQMQEESYDAEGFADVFFFEYLFPEFKQVYADITKLQMDIYGQIDNQRNNKELAFNRKYIYHRPLKLKSQKQQFSYRSEDQLMPIMISQQNVRFCFQQFELVKHKSEEQKPQLFNQ